jgi:hypothetical protein
LFLVLLFWVLCLYHGRAAKCALATTTDLVCGR